MLTSFVITIPPSPIAPRFLLGKNEKHPRVPILPAFFIPFFEEYLAPIA